MMTIISSYFTQSMSEWGGTQQLLRVAVPMTCVLLAVKAYEFWPTSKGKHVSHQALENAKFALSALDDELEIGGIWPPPNAPRTRMRYLATLVADCRSSITGISLDTPANRLVAERFYAKHMTDRGMRPKHISGNLALLVEMTFVPTQGDLDAEEFRNTMAVIKRKRDHHDGFFNITWSWHGPRITRAPAIGRA